MNRPPEVHLGTSTTLLFGWKCVDTMGVCFLGCLGPIYFMPSTSGNLGSREGGCWGQIYNIAPMEDSYSFRGCNLLHDPQLTSDLLAHTSSTTWPSSLLVSFLSALKILLIRWALNPCRSSIYTTLIWQGLCSHVTHLCFGDSNTSGV